MLIKTQKNINAKAMSAYMGVAERTVRTYLKQMADAKMIQYTGTTSNWRWEITLKVR